MTIDSGQALPDPLVVNDGSKPAETDPSAASTSPLTVEAYDENGFSITKDETTGIPEGVTVTDLQVIASENANSDGDETQFAGRTSKTASVNGYRLSPADSDGNEITSSVVITIAAFETPDNRVGDDGRYEQRGGETHH